MKRTKTMVAAALMTGLVASACNLNGDVIDCGVTANANDPKCTLGMLGTLGSGPAFWDGSSVVRGFGQGFVDGNEVILPVNGFKVGANFAGGIFAVDVKTGNRRAVAGSYFDPATYAVGTKGTGPFPFGTASAVVAGVADGAKVYYALVIDKSNPQGELRRIVKIDPATGNWSEAVALTRNPCGFILGGEPDSPQGALAIDGSGFFYAFYVTNGNPNASRGILRIDPTTGLCYSPDTGKVFSATGSGPYVGTQAGVDGAVGTGPDFGEGLVRGLTFHQGKLWAINRDAGQLISIDIGTGNRTVVSAHRNPAKGQGSEGIGGRYLTFAGGKIITSGSCGSGCTDTSPLKTVDPVSGDRAAIALNKGPTMRPDENLPVFAGPDGLLLVGDGARKALLLVDPEAGLVNFLSY